MPFSVSGGSPDGDVIAIAIASDSVFIERTITVHFYSPADYDQNHDVDKDDLPIIENSWLKQVGEPGYDPKANLNQDAPGRVDLYDFVIFCRE